MIKMLRFLLIISLIGIGFGQEESTSCGQEVCLSIGQVDSDNYTIEVNYESIVPILGYQFNVSGVDIESGTNGASTEYGLNITASPNSILAWGLTSGIPAGSGHLLTLNYQPGPGEEACIVPSGESEQFLITTSFSGSTASSNSEVCTAITPPAVDCAGVYGGDAVEDNCQFCDNDPTNDCVQDCTGEWGGDAELDPCGICNGNSSPVDFDNDGTPDDCDDTDYGDVSIQFGTIDLENKTIELNFISNTPLYGIQFLIDNLAMGSIEPSEAIPEEFTIGFNENGQVLIYSSQGLITIPANTDINLTIGFDSIVGEQICISENDAVSFVTSNSGHLADVTIQNGCLSVEQDCNGTWGGIEVEDPCGECGGNGIAEACDCQDTSGLNENGCCDAISKDCNGVCGGDALEDNCGTCDSDASNDCVQDCFGEWGGDAYDQGCGCGVYDQLPTDGCDDMCGSTATLDNCGICDDDNSNDCVQDCFGEWGGDAYDQGCGCGVYDQLPTDGCDDVCGSTATLDNCGNCDDNNSNDCVQDCAGEWGGLATVDNCGQCDDNSSNDCIQDCEGIWGGLANEDACGVCDTDPLNDCDLLNANAGNDQSINIPHDGNPNTNTVEVTLDGSMSTGEIESCVWTSGNRDNHEGCEVALTLTPGVYTFTLNVTDVDGEMDSDELILTINDEPNNPPTANISNTDLEFQAEHSGNPLNDEAMVTLDGTPSSDPEDDDFLYSWQQISGNYVDLGENSASTLSFNAPIGEYGIELIVTDVYGDSHSTDVLVIVTPADNESPIVNAGGDIFEQVESDCNPETNSISINLPGENYDVSDADNDNLTYSWTNGEEEICNTLECSVELEASNEAYNLTLTITDTYGGIGSDDIAVQIDSEETGEGPIALGPFNQLYTVEHDGDVNTTEVSVSLLGAGTDNDSEDLSYYWLDSNGDTLGLGEEFTTTLTGPNFAGDDVTYQFTFGVSDCYQTSTENFNVTIQSEPNFNPVINLTNSTFYDTLSYGESSSIVNINLCNDVSDGNTEDVLTYSWLLNGVNMPETNCSISFTANGNDNLTFSVTDPYGASDSENISVILVSAENQSPIVNLPELLDYFTVIHDGSPITNTMNVEFTPTSDQVNDPENDGLTYVWSQTSGELVSFNPVVNTLSFEATAGDYCFNLVATDVMGGSSNAGFCITVNPEPNAIPLATDMPDTVVTIAHDGDPNTHTETVTICADGSDPDGDTYSFLWDNGKTTTCISEDITKLEQTCFNFEVLDAYSEPESGWNSDEICVSLYEPNAIPTISVQYDNEFEIPHDGFYGGTASITIETEGTADGNGDPLFYQWYNVDELNSNIHTLLNNENSNSLTIDGLEIGDYHYRLRVTDTYGNFDGDEFFAEQDVQFMVLPESNINAVADAGADYSIQPSHDNILGEDLTITLIGDNSSDANPEDALIYSWKLISKQVAENEAESMDEMISSDVNFDFSYSYNGEAVEQLTFELSVQDDYMVNEDVKSTSEVTVTLIPEENEIPNAESISFIQEQVEHDGDASTNSTTIVIDGNSSTDPDGDDLTFNWTDQDGASYGNGVQMTTSLTPGTYQFTLTVADGYGSNDQSQTTVIVLPEENNSPSANAGEDLTLFANHDGNPEIPNLTYNACGEGADNDAVDNLSFSWNDNELSANPCAELTVVHSDEADCHTFNVNDGYETVSDEICFTIEEPNDAPVISTESNEMNAILTHDGTPGGEVSVNLSITDEVQDSHSCNWVMGEEELTGDCNSVNLPIGENAVRVIVADSYGSMGSLDLTITVEEENATPIANAGDDFEVTLVHDGIPNEGEIEITMDASASSDSDNDPLEYSWYPGDLTESNRNSMAGSGASFTTSLGEGVHYFSVIVEDNYGANDTASVMVTVNAEPNAGPTVSAEVEGSPQAEHGGNPTTDVGEFTINAIGTDTDEVDGEPTYQWTQVSGEGIESLTGENTSSISGFALTGEYTFSVMVTDVYGESSSTTIDLNIAEAPNNQPQIADVQNISEEISHDHDPTTMDVLVSLSAEGSTDGDNDNLTFIWYMNGDSIASGINPSITLTGGTDQVCNYFSVQVFDGYENNGTDSDNFQICIDPEPNTKPTIDAELTQSFEVEHDGDPNTTGLSVQISASGSDEDGDEITYHWTQNSEDSFQVELIGADTKNPTFSSFVDSEQTLTFELVVTDSYDESSTETITVNLSPEQNNAPILTGSNNAPDMISHDGSSETNSEMVNLSVTIEDEDEDAHHIEWFNSDGDLIAEDVTEIQLELGASAHSYSVSVTDSYGALGTSNFDFSINPEENNEPQLNISGNQSLAFNTACDGEAEVAGLYSVSIADADEVDSHSCSWTNEANEEICDSCNDCSFEFTEIGSFTYSVAVNDGYGVVAESITISVEDSFTNDDPVANAGSDASYTLDYDGVPGGCTNVQLDACGSNDECSNDQLIYTWSNESETILETSNCMDSVELCNENHEDTNFTLSLTVSDPDGGSDTDEVIITLEQEQTLDPVCEVTAYQTVEIEHDGNPECNEITVEFSGSCSTTFEANELQLSWTQSSGPAVEISETQDNDFSVDLCTDNSAQEYCFKLNATDEFGVSGFGESCVLVNPEPNTNPIVEFVNNSVSDTLVHDGDPNTNSMEVNLTANVDDADNTEEMNEISSINWTDSDGNSICSNADCNPMVTTDGACFTVTATDNYGASGSNEICVSVTEPNTPPTAIIEELEQSDLEIPHNGIPNEGGISVTLDADSSTDADGDEDHGLTYLWSNGETSPIITIDGLTAGEYQYSVSVSDPYSASSNATISFTVYEPNSAPSADAGLDNIFTLPHNCILEDDLQSIVFDAGNSSDEDGDFLTTFNWIDLATGESICDDVDCVKTHGLGEYSYELTVSDVYGVTDTDTVNYTVQIPNVGPECQLASETIIINEFEDYTINGCGSSDEENCSLDFNWTGESSSQDCANTYQAPEVITNDAVTLNYTLEVTDQYGATCDIDQTVIVENINVAPELVFSCSHDGQLLEDGGSYSIPHDGDPNTSVFTIECDATPSSDFDNDDLTFEWTAENTNKTGAIVTYDLTEGSRPVTVTVDDGFGGTVSSEITLDINAEPNSAPEIEFVETPIIITENDYLQFSNCNDASDNDGDEINYFWTEESNSCLHDISISSPNNCSYASIVTPNILTNDFCVFTANLHVDDTYEDSFDDEVQTIIVTNINEEPEEVVNRLTDDNYFVLDADFNCDPTIVVADTILCATFDDPDNDDLNYIWNCKNTDTQDSIHSHNELISYQEGGMQSCSELITFNGEGNYECILEVTDVFEQGDYFDEPISVQKVYNITVEQNTLANLSAEVDNPVIELNEFDSYNFDGSISTHQYGCDLNYQWTKDGETVSVNSNYPYTAPELFTNEPIEQSFELQISDVYGNENFISHEFTVNNINQLPTGFIHSINDVTLEHDCVENATTSISLIAEFEDADSDQLCYDWFINGVLQNDAEECGESILDVDLGAEQYNVSVVVNDIVNGIHNELTVIEIEEFEIFAPENQIPEFSNFNGIEETIVHDCDTLTITTSIEICAEATDADNDPLTYQWSNGKTTECISEELSAGVHELHVEVADCYDSNSKSFSVIVNEEPNEPPVVEEISDIETTIVHDCDPETDTAPIEICAIATDFDGDPLEYNWSTGKTTACIDEELTAGLHEIEVEVTDCYGEVDTEIVTITVNEEPNTPPTIEEIADKEETIEHDGDPETDTAPIEICAEASDSDGDPLTFEWSNGKTTECITEELQAGVYEFEFEVFDCYDESDSESITVTVLPEPNEFPIAYAGEDQEVGFGVDCDTNSVVLSGNCEDGDGDFTTCSWINEFGEIVSNQCEDNISVGCPHEDMIFTLSCKDSYSDVGTDDVLIELGNLPPVCPTLPESFPVAIEDKIQFKIEDYCFDPNEIALNDRIEDCEITQIFDGENCTSSEIQIVNLGDCEFDIQLPDLMENSMDDFDENYCIELNVADSFGENITQYFELEYKECNSSEMRPLEPGNNLISFTCFPIDYTTEALVDLNSNINFIIGQGQGLFGTVNGWTGNLNKLDYHDGYWINLDGTNDNQLIYNGIMVNNNTAYEIEDGNNLIGIHGNAINIYELYDVFNGEDFFTNNFNFITTAGLGLFNDPDGWIGNLISLYPFTGYWINSKDCSDYFGCIDEDNCDECGDNDDRDILITLNFPDESESISRDIIETPQIRDEFKVAQSMEQSFYLADEILVDGITAKVGDIILAFNDDILTGSAIIEDGPTTIPVMGRDITEQTIGFHEIGQVPTFKLFSSETGELIKLSSENSIGWSPMALHQLGSLSGETPKVVVDKFTFDTPYPNPFNPVTIFKYGLPEDGKVSISVYNLTGEKVDELLNETQSSGLYSMDWNATSMAAGIYFIQLEVVENDGNIYQQNQKVILLK